MRLHRLALALVLVILVLGGWVWSRVTDRVLAEARAPSGEGLVRVREIQMHPVSLGAILRVNEKIYRCEYYPHQKWPMFSCDTFASESTEIRRAEIEWNSGQSATVTLDGQVVFECVNGRWSRHDQ